MEKLKVAMRKRGGGALPETGIREADAIVECKRVKERQGFRVLFRTGPSTGTSGLHVGHTITAVLPALYRFIGGKCFFSHNTVGLT